MGPLYMSLQSLCQDPVSIVQRRLIGSMQLRWATLTGRPAVTALSTLQEGRLPPCLELLAKHLQHYQPCRVPPWQKDSGDSRDATPNKICNVARAA